MRIITFIILLIIPFSAIYGNEINKTESRVTIIEFSNGKHWMAFDLQKYIGDDIGKKHPDEKFKDEIDFNLFPNPVTSEKATLSFSLEKKSDVKIYGHGEGGNKIDLFDDILCPGKHNIDLNLSDFDRGMILLYPEIDGKIYCVKAIKM